MHVVLLHIAQPAIAMITLYCSESGGGADIIGSYTVTTGILWVKAHSHLERSGGMLLQIF